MSERDFMAEVRREREAERILLGEFGSDGAAAALAFLEARERIDELTTAERERDEWKRRYFLVADAVAPQSDSAEHLADIARETRSERDEARRALAHVRQQAGAWKQEARTQKHTVDGVGEVLGGVPDYGPIVASVEALRHRAERAERVVEAAHAIFDAWTESEDWEAHSRLMKALAELRALDAAEGTP